MNRRSFRPARVDVAPERNRTLSHSSTDRLPPSWQRLLALSGVAFAVLFVVGWFASGGDAPDYRAADQDWTDWAEDNQWRSRIGGFLMLLAGFLFLHFAGTIRSVLGSAESAGPALHNSRAPRSPVPLSASRG